VAAVRQTRGFRWPCRGKQFMRITAMSSACEGGGTGRLPSSDALPGAEPAKIAFSFPDQRCVPGGDKSEIALRPAGHI